MNEADGIMDAELSSGMRSLNLTKPNYHHETETEPWKLDERSERMFNIFIPLERESKIVGFYLPQELRKRFAELIVELRQPYIDTLDAGQKHRRNLLNHGTISLNAFRRPSAKSRRIYNTRLIDNACTELRIT